MMRGRDRYRLGVTATTEGVGCQWDGSAWRRTVTGGRFPQVLEKVPPSCEAPDPGKKPCAIRIQPSVAGGEISSVQKEAGRFR